MEGREIRAYETVGSAKDYGIVPLYLVRDLDKGMSLRIEILGFSGQKRDLVVYGQSCLKGIRQFPGLGTSQFCREVSYRAVNDQKLVSVQEPLYPQR